MDYRASLSMAFAVTRNTNGKVDPEEPATGVFDSDDEEEPDGTLTIRDRRGNIYEYGREEWLSADKDYTKHIGGKTVITELGNVEPKSGKADIKPKKGN
ncbi:MAG: hypothetical protein LWY06_13920 [Firmicutes bacterium]|nr:hypothetical protein [Bacillota bacterium]